MQLMKCNFDGKQGAGREQRSQVTSPNEEIMTFSNGVLINRSSVSDSSFSPVGILSETF